MGNRHHGFVKTVDGRIVLPVERAVKFQLLLSERTEFLDGYVLDFNTRPGFGSIFSRLRLTTGLADRLQLAEKIVGKQAWVGIIGIIRTAVGLYLFYRLRLRRFSGSGFRLRLYLWRLVRRNRLDNLLLGVFQLLADCHTFTGPHKFGQIGVEGMMRKASQFDIFIPAVGSACQSNT